MVERKAVAGTLENADKESVNLMEFSSKSSSSQNITTDTFANQTLTSTDAANEEWVTLSDSIRMQCDVSVYHSPDDFYVVLQNDA